MSEHRFGEDTLDFLYHSDDITQYAVRVLIDEIREHRALEATITCDGCGHKLVCMCEDD
jgi:hypothetical protein